jgi:hypothetical protein
LNTVKDSAKQVFENPVFPIARMKYENPPCSLFSIYVQLPKLNVAGSIPVSRSIKSAVYEVPKISAFLLLRLFSRLP